MRLALWSTHRLAPRKHVPLSSSSSATILWNDHVVKCGRIYAKCKTSLDSEASHRRPLNLSDYSRDHRVSRSRMEQVRRLILSYHTSTGTRKESGFTLSHAKLVSTLRSRCKLEIRHTTISTPSHTKLVPVQHLRRKLETQYDCLCTHNNVTTASVISHAKLVSRPFSRYHARSIIWHKPICSRAEELLIKAIFQHRRQQHRNSIM